MKHVKNKLPALCEHLVPFDFYMKPCGKPAKYEHHFPDPKAKPMMVCGIHKRVMERRTK